MPMVDYMPEPGSFADRVLHMVATAGERTFTSRDLATKFNVHPGGVPGLLEPAVHGRYLRELQSSAGKEWGIGAKFAEWQERRKFVVAADKPAPASAPPAAPPGKKPPKTRGPLPRLPDLKLAELVFHTDVPLPPKDTTRTVDKYAGLWARLTVGVCVDLPTQYHKSLASIIKRRQKQGLGTYAIRTIDAQTFRLWRTA